MINFQRLQAKSPSPAKPAEKPQPKASVTRRSSPTTNKKGAKASPKPAAAAAASADASKLGLDATAPGDEIEVEVGSAVAHCLSKLSEQLHTGADRCLLPANTNFTGLWCDAVVWESLRSTTELKPCIPELLSTFEGHPSLYHSSASDTH